MLDAKAPVLPAADLFWITPDAHVIGDVQVGASVGTWFGAVVRGDNEPIVIHEGSNLQEGVLLHTDSKWIRVSSRAV